MNTSEVSNNSRRSFLKKAAYAAPVVMALGALTAPVSAHASYVHISQLQNKPAARTADLYQQNDGTKWVKSYENDLSHPAETNVFKEPTSLYSWLKSFFA